MMYFPTWSLPASEINEVLTPQRPNDVMALKVDPPGTASTGLLSLKMISKTVSPIPITFRILL